MRTDRCSACWGAVSAGACIVLLSRPLRPKTDMRRMTAAPALQSLLPLLELRPREAAVIDKLFRRLSGTASIKKTNHAEGWFRQTSALLCWTVFPVYTFSDNPSHTGLCMQRSSYRQEHGTWLDHA